MSCTVAGPRDIDDPEASFCKLEGEGFFLGLDLTPSCRDVLIDTQRTRNKFLLNLSVFCFSNAVYHIICILLRGRDTEICWKE